MIPKINNKIIEIDDEITTEMALDLCKHYEFEHLVSRIDKEQEAFKD